MIQKFLSLWMLCLAPLSGLCQNQEPFPSLTSKKGLQVQMVDDALALGVKHAGINVNLGQLLAVAPSATTVEWTFGGLSLLIQGDYARHLDAQIKPLSDAGLAVYLILILYPTKDPVKDALLIHPRAKAEGKYNVAGFNTVTEDGMKHFQGLIDFLAARYSRPSRERGRVWGYIVGNEVNSHWMWYNMGDSTLEQTAGEYEKAVRATHETVRRHSAHARCYLSFDHHWMASMPGISDHEAHSGRSLLDAFARVACERGDFEWHVAHHPYPDDLGNPRTWLDKAAWPTEDSPHITFKNLHVACRYMERPELLWEGRARRIILSEQGIHCLASPEGEQLQGAGFVYAWEKTAAQPGIDALIWHRHVDHAHEGGLRLGLWENVPGSISSPGRQRLIYHLFQKADTPEWEQARQFALPIFGRAAP